LDRPLILGIAVSLLSFGIMFFFIALLIVNVLYGSSGNGVVFLALELFAAVLTTIGIGMLVYGAAKNPLPPSH
jgi:hypothetical protein